MIRPRPGRTFTRRVLGLIAMTIALYALLTTLVYGLVSRSTFAALKASELDPKLGRIVELIESTLPEDDELGESGIMNGDITNMPFIRQLDPELLDAFVLVVNAAGESLYNNVMPDDATPGMLLGTNLEKVIGGENVIFSLSMPAWRIDVLAVGAPVMHNGRAVGGVFLFKPQVEIAASQYAVLLALLVSMGAVLLVAALPAYFMARRVSRPLGQMRDVALRMAHGDFTARADVSQGDEFSQLGHSLNHLAQELSHTISALTVERNRVLAILNGIGEGIIAVDTQGAITHSNPAVRRLFGVETASAPNSADGEGNTSPDAAAQDTTSDGEPSVHIKHVYTLRDALPAGILDDFKTVITSRAPLTREMVLTSEGITVLAPGQTPPLSTSPVILRLSIAPIDDGNRHTVGAVALFRDITQSERLEQTRREYVANVSHEMRTPLTALRGLIEPLRDGMVRDEAARMRYYNIMMRETMRLSRLINDLMELSRLQSGQLSLKLEPVKLNPLLDDLAEKYHSKADDSELEFSIDVPDNLPTVLGNEDRIEQVLVILLDNAMKYTPSISSDGKPGWVRLEAEPTTNYVRLRVRDNGLGISEADLPHIFERFYKVDKAHSGMGSGLGLSIAHEIVQRMGQSLTVESELGRGSVFTLTVQRADK